MQVEVGQVQRLGPPVEKLEYQVQSRETLHQQCSGLESSGRWVRNVQRYRWVVADLLLETREVEMRRRLQITFIGRSPEYLTMSIAGFKLVCLYAPTVRLSVSPLT